MLRFRKCLPGCGADFEKLVIAGIDATPDGLAAMQRGELDVTVFQDAKGQAYGAVDTAMKMIKKEPVDQAVWVPFQMLTLSNVNDFK